MENKIKTAINNILKGTQMQKFSWEVAERNSEYRLRLGTGVVTVDKWIGTDDESGQEFSMADITIYNNAGVEVDRTIVSRQEEPGDYELLTTLYDAARRSALKVDQTLETLLGEIDKAVN